MIFMSFIVQYNFYFFIFIFLFKFLRYLMSINTTHKINILSTSIISNTILIRYNKTISIKSNLNIYHITFDKRTLIIVITISKFYLILFSNFMIVHKRRTSFWFLFSWKFRIFFKIFNSFDVIHVNKKNKLDGTI